MKAPRESVRELFEPPFTSEPGSFNILDDNDNVVACFGFVMRRFWACGRERIQGMANSGELIGAWQADFKEIVPDQSVSPPEVCRLLTDAWAATA